MCLAECGYCWWQGGTKATLGSTAPWELFYHLLTLIANKEYPAWPFPRQRLTTGGPLMRFQKVLYFDFEKATHSLRKKVSRSSNCLRKSQAGYLALSTARVWRWQRLARGSRVAKKYHGEDSHGGSWLGAHAVLINVSGLPSAPKLKIDSDDWGGIAMAVTWRNELKYCSVQHHITLTNCYWMVIRLRLSTYILLSHFIFIALLWGRLRWET